MSSGRLDNDEAVYAMRQVVSCGFEKSAVCTTLTHCIKLTSSVHSSAVEKLKTWQVIRNVNLRLGGDVFEQSEVGGNFPVLESAVI